MAEKSTLDEEAGTTAHNQAHNHAMRFAGSFKGWKEVVFSLAVKSF